MADEEPGIEEVDIPVVALKPILENPPPPGISEPETPNPPVIIDEPVLEPMVVDPVVTEPIPEQTIEPEKPVETPPEATPVSVLPAARPQITPSIPDEPRSEATKPRSSSELTTGAQISATDFVASLTDEQLKAAATLYTKRNQAEFGRRGVAKRKETMELNLREITDYLSRNNGAPLPRIAKNTNITPGTTSKYLRQLIASDKVRADGWGKTRRYYLK